MPPPPPPPLLLDENPDEPPEPPLDDEPDDDGGFEALPTSRLKRLISRPKLSNDEAPTQNEVSGGSMRPCSANSRHTFVHLSVRSNSTAHGR